MLTTGREQQRSDTLYVSTEQEQMSPREIEGNQKSCLTSLIFGLFFLQREKITAKKGHATTLQC